MTVAALAGVWLGAACLLAALLALVFRGAGLGERDEPIPVRYDGHLPAPRESHEQAVRLQG